MSADKSKPKPKATNKPETIPVKISDGADVKPAKPAPVKAEKTAPTPVKSPAKAVPVAASDAPKPAKDTIYVDNDDEITAIIDKVEGAKADDVSLVLPKRAQVLQSIVNMRLLKRSADEADKNLTLVTNESAILPLAGAAGVNVAKNLQSKASIPASPIPIKGAAGVAVAAGIAAAANEDLDENDATLDYHRSMGELAVNEEADEPETIHLAEDAAAAAGGAKAAQTAKKAVKAPKDKKLKVPNFDKFRALLIVGIVALIALVVGLIVAAKVLPKATINVQTTGTPVSANFNLNTSDKATTLDETKMIIPATLQSKDQTSSQSVQATGTQNNGTKATGSVTLDAACTDYPKTAPSVGGGSVVTAGSLNYVISSTNKDWSLNPAGGCHWEANFSITATAGGANYNQSGTFTSKSYSNVSGSGSATGGTDNTVTVVAQADIDKAKAAVTSQSSDAFSKDWQKSLTDKGLYIIAPTLKISEPVVTTTPSLGQPASTVSVNIKITYSVLTVKKDDLKKVVSDQLKKQIDTSKQQILDSDVLKNVVMTVQSQTSPTIAVLNVTSDVSATPNIDVDSIKKQAANKKAGEIRDLVSNVTGVKNVDVKMSPFWVSAVPASKIKVNLTQVTSSSVNSSSSSNGQQP